MRALGFALVLVLGSPAVVPSHTGHAEAPGTEGAGSGGTGPIRVSEVARRNLGVRIEEVELRSIEDTITVI